MSAIEDTKAYLVLHHGKHYKSRRMVASHTLLYNLLKEVESLQAKLKGVS